MRFPIGDPALFDRAKELRRNMTEAEHVLWRELARSAVGVPFRRQEPMLAFIIDFYSPFAQLAVEVDGPVHDGEKAYDAERDARLEEIGVRVLRFSNADVIHDLRSVVERIRNAVDARLAERDARTRHRPPRRGGSRGGRVWSRALE